MRGRTAFTLLQLMCLASCSYSASGAEAATNSSSIVNKQNSDSDITDIRRTSEHDLSNKTPVAAPNEQTDSTDEANLGSSLTVGDLKHRLTQAHDLLLGDLDQLSSGSYHGRNWLAAIEQLQQIASHMVASPTTIVPVSSDHSVTHPASTLEPAQQSINETSDALIPTSHTFQHSIRQLDEHTSSSPISLANSVVTNENLGDSQDVQSEMESNDSVADTNLHAISQNPSAMHDGSHAEDGVDNNMNGGSSNNVTQNGSTQQINNTGMPRLIPNGIGNMALYAKKWRKTGVQVAAQAAFTLTALKAADLLHLEPPQADEASAYVSPVHGKHQQAGLLGGEDALMSDLMAELHEQVLAGSTEAALSLADRYFTGFDVPRSCWTGNMYASVAADGLLAELNEEAASGRRIQPSEVPELRSLHIHGRDFAGHLNVQDAAVTMDTDLASRGSSYAQRRMAYRQLTGTGLPANTAQAVEYFEALAAAGDPYAMGNLAIMLWRGVGVQRDVARAHTLLQRAAEAGYAPAWNGLGVLYWSGDLGHVNITTAMSMLQKGADVNQPDALYNLGLLKKQASLHEEAVNLFERADALGHWKAPLTLAEHYASGIGVERSCTTAEKYYRKLFAKCATWDSALKAALAAYSSGDYWSAFLQYILLAEQGCSSAAANAGWMLLQRKGYTGPGYLDLASRLLERAARQNHTSAAVDLGHMLLQASPMNLRFQTNVSTAILWFDVAGDLKDPEGLFLAGWAHHIGHGIVSGRNSNAAVAYYRQSITAAGTMQGHAVAAWLALLTLRIDICLEAIGISPLPITNLAIQLQKFFLRHPWQETAAGQLENDKSQLVSTSQQLLRLTEPAANASTFTSSTSPDAENTCLVVTVVMLVLLLWIRNRICMRHPHVLPHHEHSLDESLRVGTTVRQLDGARRHEGVVDTSHNENSLGHHALTVTYRRSVTIPSGSPVRGPSDHGGIQPACETPTALAAALE